MTDREAEPEQNTFDVVLVSVGPHEDLCIKFVRELTGLGLKEAEHLVESLPKVLKVQISRAEAEEIKSKFDSVGASVTLE